MNVLRDLFLFRREADPLWPKGRKALYFLWRGLLLLCGAITLGLLLLTLAYGPYPDEIVSGYFASGTIVVLNTLPVLLLTLLVWGLSGRTWLAFLLGGGASLALALGNYYKLYFRDDPVYFEDMLILREAAAMATEQSYDLFLTRRIAGIALGWLLGTLLLALVARGRLPGKGRLAVSAAAVAIAAALTPVYLNTTLYDSVDNYEHLNQWSPTQSYVARGFFYPFVHSAGDFIQLPPAGYSESRAEQLLARYEDQDIPADRQVDVIAIMREAYVDFSRFDIEGLDASGYDLYHQLEAESYSGTLLTNIFAGGTIDSERCFLTGNYQLRNFRANTSSYLWYLRQQGYTVEGSHPYYQWFYNRQNINAYLGFERYRFLEGDYRALTDAPLPEDSILYREVYEDYVKNKESGKPYFSFVLNVESHGPYDTASYDGEQVYLTGDYSPEARCAINNYMDAIMEGDRALMELVEKLRAEAEPVVLLLFSDHLPWMGDGNVFYEEMGLDIDPGTETGFRNHYSTRYLIWANDAAKAALEEEFTGEGPTVSPFYLMNLLFELCGWEGPAFMQAMDEMLKIFPVVTTNGCYVVDGVFTDTIPAQRQAAFEEFLILQHYWRNEFLFH